MPTVKTRYGLVDRDGLHALAEEFDTGRIIEAIDAVDLARAQIDDLRDKLLTLHGVVVDVLGGISINPVSEGADDIFDLLEIISSAALDMDEAGELTLAITHDLDRLGSDDVWRERDDF